MIARLIEAEKIADSLFAYVEQSGLIAPGISEKELNTAIYRIAAEQFGIKKYWHKRIVRAGKNTLFPYRENPPDLTLRENDILFLDFGPILDEWEADLGRTYVLGNNPEMHRIKKDVEEIWHLGHRFFSENKTNITGARLYAKTQEFARERGWEFGNIHAGHLIGEFPHEKVHSEDEINYIHPNNHIPMQEAGANGQERYWIYEVHLIHPELAIGAFFEQLLTD